MRQQMSRRRGGDKFRCSFFSTVPAVQREGGGAATVENQTDQWGEPKRDWGRVDAWRRTQNSSEHTNRHTHARTHTHTKKRTFIRRVIVSSPSSSRQRCVHTSSSSWSSWLLFVPRVLVIFFFDFFFRFSSASISFPRVFVCVCVVCVLCVALAAADPLRWPSRPLNGRLGERDSQVARIAQLVIVHFLEREQGRNKNRKTHTVEGKRNQPRPYTLSQTQQQNQLEPVP